MKCLGSGDGPRVVVSHSMGTIIAYDCLMHEPSARQWTF
jgi:alpha-beta hydrolase superfamily lysophospholipase